MHKCKSSMKMNNERSRTLGGMLAWVNAEWHAGHPMMAIANRFFCCSSSSLTILCARTGSFLSTLDAQLIISMALSSYYCCKLHSSVALPFHKVLDTQAFAVDTIDPVQQSIKRRINGWCTVGARPFSLLNSHGEL